MGIRDNFSNIKVLLLNLFLSPNESSFIQVYILLICLSFDHGADGKNFLAGILHKCICAEFSTVPRAVPPCHHLQDNMKKKINMRNNISKWNGYIYKSCFMECFELFELVIEIHSY